MNKKFCRYSMTGQEDENVNKEGCLRSEFCDGYSAH